MGSLVPAVGRETCDHEALTGHTQSPTDHTGTPSRQTQPTSLDTTLRPLHSSQDHREVPPVQAGPSPGDLVHTGPGLHMDIHGLRWRGSEYGPRTPRHHHLS